MLSRTLATVAVLTLASMMGGCSNDSGSQRQADVKSTDPKIAPAIESEGDAVNHLEPDDVRGVTNETAHPADSSDKPGQERLSDPVVTERRGPVTVRVNWNPVDLGDSERELCVTFAVAAGWHIYAEVPGASPYPVTSIELDLPAGAEAIGSWNRPAGVPCLEMPGTLVFMGTVTFSQSIRLPAKATPVGVKINYQACQGRICNPPETISLSLPSEGT